MKHADEIRLHQLQEELAILDNNMVDIDGVKLRASQCYHLQLDPAHVLFNTNCPDELRQRIQEIMSKYIPDESSAQQ